MNKKHFNCPYLTESNIEVRVSNVVTQTTILPGMASLGTMKDIHPTITNIVLGM